MEGTGKVIWLLQEILDVLRARNPRPFSTAPALGAMVAQCVQSKVTAGRRAIYVRSLGDYLARFIKGRESLPINQVTPEMVEHYLWAFNGHSRATHLNRISTLFSYAVKRGYITANPCDRIERAKIDRRTPRILTPSEARKIYAAAPTIVRPCLVLCMYAGIRPDECHRLTWADVDLANKRVTISEAASKVRARRIVPLPDIAVHLLSQHPLKIGPVAPSRSTVRRFKRIARALVGGWPADILRHTAASYLLALHEDPGKVSFWLGNSAKILLTHYNGIATREDAEKFFGIKTL